MDTVSILDEVRAYGRTRETPDEVFDYYKKEYPGSKTLKNGKVQYAWQGKLADDLSQVLGIERKSVMRRFQGVRAGKVSKSQEDEYQALGQSLPLIPPEGRGHITGTIWVKYSEDCEDREVDIDLSHADVVRLFEMAVDEMIQAVANGYQSNQPGDVDIDFKGPDWCAEPDLQFEMIEE